MKCYRVTIEADINPAEFSSPRQVAGIVAVKLGIRSIRLSSVNAEELEAGQTAELVIGST